MGERIKVSQKKPSTEIGLNFFAAYKSTSHSSISNSKRTLASQVLHLQRTIGNWEVTRLIRSSALQGRLKIARSGDIYEKEVEHVADQVMRMPERSSVRRKSSCLECEEKESGIQRQTGKEEKVEIQTKPLADQITPLFRKEIAPEEEVQTKLVDNSSLQRQVEEDEGKSLQTKQNHNQTLVATPGIESCINALRGSGQPLSESTRAFFEPRFGVDFSQVRVHTDSRASQTAQSINARAFTTGRDIVFGQGQYSPGTSNGKHLLAHELTHVVQQKASLTPQ